MPVRRLVPLFALALGSAIVPAAAQTLYLREATSGDAFVEAAVGDTVDIEVRADLGGMSAAAIALHVRLSADLFAVVDQGTPLRPFATGPFFAGAVELENEVRADPLLGAQQHILSYAAVLGPDAPRSRRGVGTIVHFQVACRRGVESARIELFSNPVYDTFFVAGNGRSEHRFRGLPGLALSVRAAKSSGELITAWADVKRHRAD